MKKAIIGCFLILLWSITDSFAQASSFQIGNVSTFLSSTKKPVLDASVFGKWPKVSGGAISNDGKYVSYTMRNMGPALETITVLQNSIGSWKMELKGIANVKFTEDSHQAVFIMRDDSLCLIRLGSQDKEFILHVLSFQLVSHLKGEWLAYQLSTGANELVIRNLATGWESKFGSVSSYIFSKDGGTIVLESRSEGSMGSQLSLEWVELGPMKRRVIWSGSGANLDNIVFDASRQLAFRTEKKGVRMIWYYHTGRAAATPMARGNDSDIQKGLVIGKLQRFSRDGGRLFFMLEQVEPISQPNPKDAKVTVWSYHDQKLQSEQLEDIDNKTNRTYLSVLNIGNGHILQLQQRFERIEMAENDSIGLILHLDGKPGAESWNPIYKRSVIYLVSMQNGNRRQLPWKGIATLPTFSSGGKYLIYRDGDKLDYFSYQVATGVIRNITSSIGGTNLTVDQGYLNTPIAKQSLIPIAGWMKEDAAVFIYDRHDIWMVDPAAKQVPVNITNSYGRRHGVVLRLDKRAYGTNPLIPGTELVLLGFNEQNKENGFYRKRLGQRGDPTVLTMGPYLYSEPLYASNISGRSIKARDATAWLVLRQNADESPNYFWTADLRNFKQVSDLRPERSWNWLTAELYSWQAPDGDTLQGILYRPEDFDSSKKYPVLFVYYRQLSNGLHKYLNPEGSNSEINIPWFVSRGYLVFTPDIHYRIPKLRESVLDCVGSAAEYIAKFSYVDSNRLGIQGHSFGGLETGYLVTNTHIFAAACAAAGSYDLISDAGTLLPSGASRQDEFENDLFYGPLWEKRDTYIQNSPIFDADKVTIPLLMMAGENDNIKPYGQNIEFFLALRRLGKKAWMLTYAGEDHALSDPKDIDDFTIRVTQFFDYYLKGAKAPKWMTYSLNASKKGFNIGYELDLSGRIP